MIIIAVHINIKPIVTFFFFSFVDLKEIKKKNEFKKSI